MVARVFTLSLFAMCVACEIAAPRGGLSRAEALRLADAKARSYRADIIDYTHSEPRYDTLDSSWWISYRQPGARYADFSVRVDPKTKEAFVVLR
jgi:hypothetical protein